MEKSNMRKQTIENLYPYVLVTIFMLVLFFSGCGSSSTTQAGKTPKTEPIVKPAEKPSYKPERQSARMISLPFQEKDRVGKDTGTRTKEYRLEIASPCTLEAALETSAAAPDLELQLLNETRRLIANGVASDNGRKITLDINRGEYYIRVYVPAYRDYSTLYLLTVESICGKGSSMDNPLPLKSGKPVNETVGAKTGTISRWHKFKIDTPADLNIQLSAWDSFQDLDLKLRDRTGEILISGTNTGPTERISKRVIEGNYYIEVVTAKDDTGSDYLLNLESFPLGLNAPGTSPGKAIEMTPGQVPITDSLGDIFGLKSRYYRITINPQNTGKEKCIKIYFEILNHQSDLEIELSNENKQKLPLECETQKKYIPKVGKSIYYLRVFTHQKKGASGYELSVKLIDDPNGGFIKENQEE
jgi:hypothetical protein